MKPARALSNAWPEQNAESSPGSLISWKTNVSKNDAPLLPGVADVLDLRCKLRLAQSLARWGRSRPRAGLRRLPGLALGQAPAYEPEENAGGAQV